MYQFSSGSVYGINSSGYPKKFGALQDISVDVSFTTKSLYGQNQFAIAIGRGQGKVTGKAKWANLNAGMLNDLFFGGLATQSQSVSPMFGEAWAVPASTPWQITVAQSANFIDDLGVIYAGGANAGQAFVRVGASPAVGQYAVNTGTGVYTFASADANALVQIDYTYKVTTAGLQLTLAQQLSGTTPSFGMILATKYAVPGQSVKPLYLNLFACTSTKLAMATKMDDFMVPEFDFEALAGASGNIGNFALGE